MDSGKQRGGVVVVLTLPISCAFSWISNFARKGGGRKGREEFAFFVSTLLAVKSPLLKTYV
jgi:hypothetical protein